MSINIFSSLQNLSGIGDKLAGFLAGLIGGNRIVDLLYHQPTHILPKKFLPPLYEIKGKELIITKVKVEAHIKPANSRQPFRVRCFAPSGYLTLTFFKTFPGYIEKNFAIGAEIVISGVAERFNDELQMAHPEYVFPAAQIDKIPRDEIIYPAIGAFSQKFLRSKIALALEKITDLPEWIDGNLLKQQGWMSWKEAIYKLHQNNEDKARKRLAFDELLASQIANLIAKKYLKTTNGRALVAKNNLRQKLLEALPFKLTAGQQKVLNEIDADLTSSKKMLRLLQGDVGSGKTIVAFLAMLLAVENQKQAAIICPITLLAFQHHKNFAELAQKIGVNIAILTSKTTAKNKQKILDDLKNGVIDILIGTHSLLEPDIVFKDLSLAVIDEQHRFGVMQRMKLVEKGSQVDVLLMSATPIPRSLMMTFYGDMDISILSEKPKNRLAIDTRVISQNKEEEILSAISRALKNGEKIYWICPLIEEQLGENVILSASEGSLETHRELRSNMPQEILRFAQDDNLLSNVNTRFSQFQKLFGAEKVGLIHGKMKEKEKDKIMNDFISGTTQILVATTVIEVGIDVKDATIIVIENCEQFGLSQLHQLRGRVGRGEKASYCILLYGKKIGQNGKTRLTIMKNSNDGFFIAEEDLKLRGQGEMAGKRQSGLPEYKIADLNLDLDLLQIANRQAQFLLENSGKKIDRETLRILLRIFNYDQCFKLVFGG
ncbi:MAG: ATP-dependent DNA helicase RecG [Pseudomonadota bacterium]